MNRRKLLAAVSGLTSISVAGCLGDETPGLEENDGRSDDPNENSTSSEAHEWVVSIETIEADDYLTFTGEVRSDITEGSPGELALKRVNETDQTLRIDGFHSSAIPFHGEAFEHTEDDEANL